MCRFVSMAQFFFKQQKHLHGLARLWKCENNSVMKRIKFIPRLVTDFLIKNYSWNWKSSTSVLNWCYSERWETSKIFKIIFSLFRPWSGIFIFTIQTLLSVYLKCIGRSPKLSYKRWSVKISKKMYLTVCWYWDKLDTLLTQNLMCQVCLVHATRNL